MFADDFLGLAGSGSVGSGEDQGGLVFDLTDVKEDVGFEVIPRGDYPAVVDKMEFTESARTGNPMLAVEFKITEGEFAGRVLFDYWVLAGKGAEFGLGKLKKFLTRVCPEISLSGFNPQAFAEEGVAIGRELIITVKVQTQKSGEYKGEKRNQVADIQAQSGGSFL